MNRKCLAIGVSTVVQPTDSATGKPVAGSTEFPYLDGAIDAARTIGQWARKSGFADSDVIVLTDEGDALVTEQTVKDAFATLLPSNSATDHLIVSFAGHGQTGISDDITYWLMSDSLDQGYQIFVEQMRRQLYNYGIRHLTIFSDACRAIAMTQDLRALEPRSGVQLRHAAPNPAIQVARFNACPDATKAFMVRDPKSAARGKCIFSGVLAEALWGRVPDAIDNNVVDSASLGRGLYAAVTARAQAYGLDLVPGGNPVFDKLIYFDQAAPPGPPDPDLSPWPPANGVETASAGAESGSGSNGAGAIFASLPGLDNFTLSEGPAASVLSSVGSTISAAVAVARDGLKSVTRGPKRRAADRRAKAEQVELTRAVAVRAGRQVQAETLGTTLRDVTARAGGKTVQLITDSPVKQIWFDTAIGLNATGQTLFTLPETAGQLLVQFTDGLYAPVWHYPGLSCTIVRDSHGVTALSYHAPGRADPGTAVAAEAIKRMVTGQLSAEAIDALAADLRNDKHVNPVLGSIAAYCYDITGDLDSIRRMAWYYDANQQAAPYDLIFLATLLNDGRTADVPAVPEDARRPHSGPAWLWSKTSARRVRIAGRCPWLTQGWDFLESADIVERAMTRNLIDLRAHLQPATFTTFDAEAGRAAVTRWNLERCLPG